MLKVNIRKVGDNFLYKYVKIPITYQVKSIFQIHLIDSGLGGIRFQEKNVCPFTIDYDDNPLNWSKCFNTSNWGIFLASYEGRYIGGAIVIFSNPAILRDIRVHPDFRRYGVGSKLFEHVVKWSRNQGCKQLKIETQNVNVPACQFYVKHGCHLGAINCYYNFDISELGNAVILIWYLNL